MHYYPADITRTFCLGQPTADMQKLYAIVKAANEAGIAAAGPGVPMGAVDKATRDVIEAAGYGQYFIHRTGHGLGMEGHELTPQIASGVTDLLQPGMAFTVEPGIYIPGMGGVRIEDNLVITETGQPGHHRDRRGCADQLPQTAHTLTYNEDYPPCDDQHNQEDER